MLFLEGYCSKNGDQRGKENGQIESGLSLRPSLCGISSFYFVDLIMFLRIDIILYLKPKPDTITSMAVARGTEASNLELLQRGLFQDKKEGKNSLAFESNRGLSSFVVS